MRTNTKRTYFPKYHSVNQADDDDEDIELSTHSQPKHFIVVKSHVVSIILS